MEFFNQLLGGVTDKVFLEIFCNPKSIYGYPNCFFSMSFALSEPRFTKEKPSLQFFQLSDMVQSCNVRWGYIWSNLLLDFFWNQGILTEEKLDSVLHFFDLLIIQRISSPTKFQFYTEK